MSYLSPKQWWLKPIKFIGRCQRKDYKTLHEKYNVDSLDLRIFYDKKHNLEFRHGLFRYSAKDFDKILEYCNDNKMYVRFLFEYRATTEKRKDVEELKQKFAELCKEVEEKYPSITFYGGNITGTAEFLYHFKTEVMEFGFYSSVTSLFGENDSSWKRLLDDWCPWIYARLKNKTNMQKNAVKYKGQNVCLSYDFNDIR